MTRPPKAAFTAVLVAAMLGMTSCSAPAMPRSGPPSQTTSDTSSPTVNTGSTEPNPESPEATPVVSSAAPTTEAPASSSAPASPSVEPSPTSWIHDDLNPLKGDLEHLLTPAAAQRILGEEPIVAGRVQRLQYNGSEQYVELAMDETNDSYDDLGLRIQDAKNNTSVAGGGWKKLPELGKNALMEWTEDDVTGGTFVTIYWIDGQQQGYTVSLRGLAPSKKKDAILREVMRIHKALA